MERFQVFYNIKLNCNNYITEKMCHRKLNALYSDVIQLDPEVLSQEFPWVLLYLILVH